VAWGNNTYGQLNLPSDLTNAAAIAAGYSHTVGLKSRGTEVLCGPYHCSGGGIPPPGLGKTVGIASGECLNLSLEADGSVVPWGVCPHGESVVPPTLTNVLTLSANQYHGVALVSRGSTFTSPLSPFVFPLPVTQVPPVERRFQCAVGDSVQLRGSTFAPLPLGYQWQFNGTNVVGGTNVGINLTNLQLSQSGDYSLLMTNAFGLPGTAIVHLLVTPVVITQQPQTQFALGGTNVEFDVAASGLGIFTYQWRFDGTDILNATNPSLILSNIFPAQSGAYSVVVSNSYGAVQSSDALLSVSAAQIDVEPMSQVALGGNNVEFDATPTGVAPFAYQWRFDGTNISGATNSALVLTNAAPANSGSYSVIVTNSYGSAGSSNVLLIVLPFVITNQPVSQSTYPGASITFSVAVAGAAPFTYQWLFGGTNIVGATNSLLGLTNVGADAIGAYSVIVSNQFGVINSSLATLVFSQIGAWGDNSKAQITPPFDLTDAVLIAAGGYHGLALKPDGTVVGWGDDTHGQTDFPTGESNVVQIAAGGYHSLGLRIDGTVFAWGAGKTGNETGTNGLYDPTAYGQSIIPAGLSNVVAIAAGAYHSLALRSDGKVVAWGDNTVGQLNVPTGLSNVVAIAAGFAQGLALKLDGTVVTWGYYNGPSYSPPTGLSNVVAIAAGYYDSLALKADGTIVSWGDNYNGESSVPPGLSNITAIAAGGTHSLALKADGTVISWGDNTYGENNLLPGLTNIVMIAAGGNYNGGDFNLALKGHGPPVVRVPSLHVAIIGGQALYLPAVTLGFAPLQFQWTCNGTNLSFATNRVLSLVGTQTVPGYYSITVSNTFGAASNSNALALTIIPLIITNPPQSQGALAGTNLVLSVAANGWPPFGYQWLFNGTNLVGATNASLILTNFQPSEAGDYSATVYNPFGSVTSPSAHLTVIPLIITNSPQSQTVLAGTNLTLSVAATGWLPFGYQWFFNGTNLPGATNGVLLLTNIQPSQAGTYWVAVSNSVGGVTSSHCFLTVNPLAISIQPQSQSTYIGGAPSFNVTAVLQGPFTYQWQLNGTALPGATNNPLVVTNAQLSQAGNYSVVVGNGLGFVTSSNAALFVSQEAVWGSTLYGLTTFPLGLTDIVKIAAGGYHNLVIRSNGTVRAWGDNSAGQTNVPTGLTNVVALAGGGYHSLALKKDGTVVAWGQNAYNQTNVGRGLSNVVAVSAGYYHSLALRSNGTIVAWGNNSNGQTNVPVGLQDAVAFAAGGYHNVILRSDSTVTSWGYNSNGQTNVPAGLSNIVAVSAGLYHSLALKRDGTVIAWGHNLYGETNVPKGLSNVVAIASGGYHNLALKNDGTLTAWGYNIYGQTNVPSALNGVEAVAAGVYHSLALVNKGDPYITKQPVSRTATASADIILDAAAVGAPFLYYQWQFNGNNIDGATGSTLLLTNLPLTSTGIYTFVVSNAFGVASSSPAIISVLRTTPQFGSKLQFTNGGCSFQLNGLSGHGPIVIYASSNLMDWMPVLTNPAVVGTAQFLDLSASNQPLRFYRVVEQ
jgi:alpha-tubulin suppressor-like RCC1 family protein